MPPYQRLMLAAIFPAARFRLHFGTADFGPDGSVAVASAGAVVVIGLKKPAVGSRALGGGSYRL
jgi:hypothetical protein